MYRIPTKNLSRGQGLLEMALLVPFLVLIVFGAVDLARVFHAQITLTNGSREGARIAMRANGATDFTTQVNNRVDTEVGNDFASDSSYAVSIECDPGGGNPIYPAEPTGCVRGETILVTVDYDFDLIMVSFFVPLIELSHTTEMVAP